MIFHRSIDLSISPLDNGAALPQSLPRNARHIISTSSADEGLTNHNDVMMMSELRTQCGINFLPRVHHNIMSQPTSAFSPTWQPQGGRWPPAGR